MAYRINREECVACGACQNVCPMSCISEMDDSKRKIDETICIDCGACASVCPVSCISQAE